MESLKPSLLRLLLGHHATHLAPFDESLVAVKLATVSLEGGGHQFTSKTTPVVRVYSGCSAHTIRDGSACTHASGSRGGCYMLDPRTISPLLNVLGSASMPCMLVIIADGTHQPSGPGKNGSDGVGRGRLALLVLPPVPGHSTCSIYFIEESGTLYYVMHTKCEESG